MHGTTTLPTRRRVAVTAATALIAASALLLSGCSSAATADAGDSSTDPIVIGAALGLSGGFATYDGEPLDTAKLYADKINAAGGIDGRQVEIVTADTKSTASNGPIAAKQVISDGADIVLVSCDFDQGSPAAATAIAAGKVTFSVCAGSNLFGPSGLGELAYTIGTPAAVEGAAAATFAIDQGWTSTYTLTDTSNQFQKEYTEAFAEAYADLGGEVVGADTFLSTDTTISTQTAKISSLSTQPDAVLLASQLPGGATAVQELRSAGVDVPLLAPNGMDGTSWLAQVPGLTDFYYTSYASQRGDDSDAAVNEITELYTAENGSAPTTSFAYMGWALMQVLEEGITKAGTTDGAELAAALDAMTDFPTVVGPTTFTATTHISYARSVNVNKDSDGATTLVEKLTPADVPGAPQG